MQAPLFSHRDVPSEHFSGQFSCISISISRYTYLLLQR